MDPQEIAYLPLPELFDPLLSYLSSILPPHIFSILLTLLSHTFALISAIFALVTALVTSMSSSWDPQTILPPLITLLAAYLALVSFYRTTSWMIRTAFWFVKWGGILTILAAGAGWVMGNNAGGTNALGGLFAGAGVLSAAGGLILDILNGQSQNGAGNAHSARTSRSYSSRSRSSQPQAQAKPKPKAWDSWDSHEQWRYEEKALGDQNDAADVQKVVGDIIGAAGRAIEETGWWEAAKGFVGGRVANDDEGEAVRRQKKQLDERAQGKSKAR